MQNIFMFDLGMDLASPEPDNILNGLVANTVYTQDNTTGFPIYFSDVDVGRVYKDTNPVWVEATESIQYGDLLNVYVLSEQDPKIKVRKATCTDIDKFANSVALRVEGTKVLCAVKVANVRLSGITSGPAFLSNVPGKLSASILSSGAQLVQKVGDVDSNRNFLFTFHTPAFVDSAAYSKITQK